MALSTLITERTMSHSLGFNRSIIATSAALLMLACSGATAQKAETPEEVTRHYFDAMEKGNWKANAALMHPDELARFRAVFAPLMESPKGAEGARELLGLNSPAEFRKLSDLEVFEQFLTNIMGKSPNMAEMMSNMESTILGSVIEGKDTAHVLYRMKMSGEGMNIEELEVTTLKRYGNTWRLALDKNVEGMAESISQMLNEEEVEEVPMEYDAE